MTSDTHPDAERFLIALARQAPPWRKLHLVGQMNVTLKQLALVGLRQRHPKATENELRRRLADLILGSEIAERVYGPLSSWKESVHVD